MLTVSAGYTRVRHEPRLQRLYSERRRRRGRLRRNLAGRRRRSTRRDRDGRRDLDRSAQHRRRRRGPEGRRHRRRQRGLEGRCRLPTWLCAHAARLVLSRGRGPVGMQGVELRSSNLQRRLLPRSGHGPPALLLPALVPEHVPVAASRQRLLVRAVRKPGSVPALPPVAIIPLGRPLLNGSCDLLGIESARATPAKLPSRSQTGLAPGGVCLAPLVTEGAVRSYRTVSASRRRRSILCCTFLRVPPTGR